MIDMRKKVIGEKLARNVALSTTNPTWIKPMLPCLRGENQSSECMNYGTAVLFECFILIFIMHSRVLSFQILLSVRLLNDSFILHLQRFSAVL
jgi:hypothetical protein